MLQCPWRSKVYVCVIFVFQNLKSLTLDPLITSQTTLKKLCLAIPHITKLSITEADYDDKHDGLLKAIATNLHQLKYLDISKSEVDPKAIEILLPTDDNALGGCPELVYLDLCSIQNVDVELLKKIILALPKLRFLKHELLINALGNLTEEEMGEDTARYLNTLYSRNVHSPISFDLLAKSPAFQRLKNNITTVDLDAPTADEEQQASVLLVDILMWMPKLTNVTLCRISEARHHVTSLLEYIGDRLKYLIFFDFSGNLNVLDIMRTCRNLVELTILPGLKENNPDSSLTLDNDCNRHHNQVEKPRNLPVLKYLTELNLYHNDVCNADMLTALLQSPNLTHIDLCNLDVMSDDVMFNALSSHGCSALSKVTEFLVSDCQLLTQAPFAHWLSRDNCSLQYIDFQDCKNIDYQKLRDAAAKCPRTVVIHV